MVDIRYKYWVPSQNKIRHDGGLGSVACPQVGCHYRSRSAIMVAIHLQDWIPMHGAPVGQLSQIKKVLRQYNDCCPLGFGLLSEIEVSTCVKALKWTTANQSNRLKGLQPNV
jgi:hypothetical protein